MYGGVGTLGTALVRTDAASIFATGKSWFQVPPIAKVNLTGTLPPGVTGKDVIVALCGLFQSDVLNHAVEFAGSEETMASISVDNRLTISNMSTEWSALSAMVRAPFTAIVGYLANLSNFIIVPDRQHSRTLAAGEGRRRSQASGPDDAGTHHRRED
jgi:aconitase A